MPLAALHCEQGDFPVGTDNSEDKCIANLHRVGIDCSAGSRRRNRAPRKAVQRVHVAVLLAAESQGSPIAGCRTVAKTDPKHGSGWADG